MNFGFNFSPDYYRFSVRGLYLNIIIFNLLAIPFSKISAQQTVSGVPYSIESGLPAITNYEVMPEFSNAKSLKKADQFSDRLKKLEFAHVFDIDFSPENSGEWTSLANGKKLWRLGVTSKGAYSLNMIAGVFQLEPDVKVYVYSPDHKYILGAYSSINNNSAGILAIEPLPGDSLIIEIDLPADTPEYGTLKITKLGHDFMNIFGTTIKSGYSTAVSGACNADINCDAGLSWQREKYAVCKLIVNASDLCTGTLINNTAKDKTPYVLTAHHCIDTVIKAAATVFIFNYEKWKCGGQDGPKPVSLSGSMLIATTPDLDFSLVKLYSLPPFSVRPYFAGWDHSNNAPLRTSTIHHPNGDFKKISIDENPAVTATFAEDYNPNTHWLINKWEIGTTERGSSGSPLFNQNHLFVGDLTGGDATCVSPYRDYFAKFYNSWSDYRDFKKQLKHWLDPLNSDSVSILGLDPYLPEASSCDTFRNVVVSEDKKLYNTGLTWGCYSGHNSQLVTQFAEKIDVGGALKIPGFYLYVAKAYNASPLSYVTIKLWKGGNWPGEEITTRSVYLKDFTVNKMNFLEFDSTIFVSGPVFLGYSVNYSASQDTFAVFQSPDRGISGTSGMYVFKEGIWKNVSQITNPAIYGSLHVGLVSCSLLNSVSELGLQSHKLKVYPNPVANGILTAEMLTEQNGIVSVYDLTGRKALVSSLLEGNLLQIKISDLNPGLYILKVVIPGKGIYNAKFMVVK